MFTGGSRNGLVAAIVGALLAISGPSLLSPFGTATAQAGPPTPAVTVQGEVTIAEPIEVIPPKEDPILLFTQIGANVDVIRSEPLHLIDSGSESGDDFEVPADKTLVIEYVSLETAGVLLSPGQDYQGMILVDEVIPAGRFLVCTVRGAEQIAKFGPDCGQPVKIRVPGGTPLKFGISTNVDVTVNVNIAGYLIDK